MNHFHSGFASELVDIMSKEAALSGAEAGNLAKSLSAHSAGRAVRSGMSGALYGALFHKLVDPDISAGQALRSGAGVTAGGHVGAATAKGLGIRSRKGQLISGLVGSALGLRIASKRKKKEPAKKSDG